MKTTIKPQDLRIGNYVYCESESNEPYKVTCVAENYILFDKGKVDMLAVYRALSPIPLTDEIKRKCGIKVRCIQHGKIVMGVGWDYFDNEDGRHAYVAPIDTRNIDLHCRYLHELQNLYWAVTGEELEVEL